MCGGNAVAIFNWLLVDVEKNNLEEPQLLEWAERHRILLYPFILAYHRKNISDGFLKICREKYLYNYQQVASVERFLKRFNEFLELNSLKAIVLKGVAVAENYYSDKFMRHSRDLDVWVDQHHVLFITQWLKTEGFKLETDFFSYSKKQQDLFWRTNHHFCFHGTNLRYPAILELHWKLRSNEDVCNINPFETGYLLLNTSSSNLFILNHLDQFIYLCVHGTEHGWYRIKWLLDLQFLIQRVKLDWEVVKNRANELNALEHVILSIYLVHQFTGKKIIDGFQMGSCTDALKLKSTKLLKRINQSSFIEIGYSAAFRNIFFLSSFNKRRWSLSFWSQWWVCPADWKRFPLPNNLFLLYYPLRPLFWMIRKLF